MALEAISRVRRNDGADHGVGRGSVAKAAAPLVVTVAKAAAPPGRVAPAAVLHTAAQVDAAAAAPVAAARPPRGAVLTRAVTQWTPHERLGTT